MAKPTSNLQTMCQKMVNKLTWMFTSKRIIIKTVFKEKSLLGNIPAIIFYSKAKGFNDQSSYFPLNHPQMEQEQEQETEQNNTSSVSMSRAIATSLKSCPL